MIGAGSLNVQSQRPFRQDLRLQFIEMAVNNETTFTMGVGSIAPGRPASFRGLDSRLSHFPHQ